MKWRRSAIALSLHPLPRHRGGRSPAAAVTTGGPVVSALEHAEYPLDTVEPRGNARGLRPLDRMIGDARVVGLGEATHSSHDFFAMKHRVFRHLAETKGFRTFALEGSWSTGLRLNDYVLYGKGDVRRIMREEFQADYLWWNNTDFLALLEWMRAHNQRHPQDPVRFMCNDLGWAGPSCTTRSSSTWPAPTPTFETVSPSCTGV